MGYQIAREGCYHITNSNSEGASSSVNTTLDNPVESYPS
jgi:hypothetical protein